MSAYSRNIGAELSWPIESTRRIDRMYPRQRYIYDGTGLEQELLLLSNGTGARLVFERPFCGYAHHAVLTLPAEPGKP
jgi:hypothetical protein